MNSLGCFGESSTRLSESSVAFDHHLLAASRLYELAKMAGEVTERKKKEEACDKPAS